MSAQEFQFQTETRELLNLMIHSLYSSVDIFLRELISNASDAIDKRRFEALSGNPELGVESPEIRLVVDKEARTLTIDDDGIGMSRDEVIANIGTIARSGTREFSEMVKAARASADDSGVEATQLIGQFGVGFYSSFLAADEVELVTRKAGEETATRWTSTGQGGFTVEDAERDRPGTAITLKLKPVDREDGIDDFTDEHVVRAIVRRYSDFVAYPIRFHELGSGEDKENPPLNSMKAIWTRPDSEVTEEEHKEFYKHLSHDWNDPLLHLSTRIEGTFEARALLYIPEKAPYGLHLPNVDQRGLHLYVRRVFIMDGCEELLPPYLRFVRGVVDAEDLPLNVSREILQKNRQVAAIKKHLTKKVLDRLAALLAEDRDTYLKFWTEMGTALKEGLLLSQDRNEKVLDLLVTATTHSDQPTTLAEYAQRMGERESDDKTIYFLTGADVARIKASPVLEGFAKRGIEVLIFSDTVDELWLNQFGLKYGDYEFKNAAQGDVDFGDEDEAKPGEEVTEILAKLRAALQDRVKEVRPSSRLTESAVCLVTDTGDITPQMEMLLRSSGQTVPDIKRILEVNPDHPAVTALAAKPEMVEDVAELLYGQAVLAEGGTLDDPARFGKLLSGLISRAAG